MNITVELVANSGILIHCNNRRLLVDGLYSETEYFSPPLQEMRGAREGENSPYRDIDYLIFTHRHRDHFSAEYTDRYIRNNKVKAVYLTRWQGGNPMEIDDPAPLLTATSTGICNEVCPGVGETCVFHLEEDMTLTLIGCLHSDSQRYYAIMHCALLLEVGEKRILVGSDAESCDENHQIFGKIGKVDAFFINPIYLFTKEGVRTVKTMNPAQTIIYHIPFEGEDGAYLRPLARRIMRKENDIRGLALLSEKGQTIQI